MFSMSYRIVSWYRGTIIHQGVRDNATTSYTAQSLVHWKSRKVCGSRNQSVSRFVLMVGSGYMFIRCEQSTAHAGTD